MRFIRGGWKTSGLYLSTKHNLVKIWQGTILFMLTVATQTLSLVLSSPWLWLFTRLPSEELVPQQVLEDLQGKSVHKVIKPLAPLASSQGGRANLKKQE